MQFLHKEARHMYPYRSSKLPFVAFLAWSSLFSTHTLAQAVQQAEQEVAEDLAEEEEEFFEFDEAGAGVPPIADPLESINRASFAFNDKLYRGVLKPIARGLRILPEPMRVSMSNFFGNLGAPISAASALLQGEPKNAATEAGRFLVNTTVGVVGLFDPATDMGLTQDEEDLGQTLGRYGVGHGLYLVVPFYGSTSLRDLVGATATAGLNPLYQELAPGEIAAINLSSAEVALSLDKDTYEAFYDSSLDPYVFFRSAWNQNRAGAVDK
jgi:phospholipid-binding lipoprotein MlaA